MSIAPPNVVWIKNYVYIVQPGDTLSSITKRLSGDISRYFELVGANSQKEQIQAPTGFKYNFFKSLSKDEKLKIPGSWRSFKESYGVSGPQVPPVDFPSMLGDVTFSQFDSFLVTFKTFYAWYTANSLAMGLPQIPQFSGDDIDRLASVFYGWMPYLQQALPSGTWQQYNGDLSSLLNGIAFNPQALSVVQNLLKNAADLVSVTGNTNPIPPYVVQTLPWNAIPWNQVPWGMFNQAFGGLQNTGPFYNLLNQLAPSFVSPISYGGSLFGVGQTNLNLNTGWIDPGIWNPNNSGIDPAIWQQIPWDKIGNTDWQKVVDAISKYGVGTAANLANATNCWNSCVSDPTQHTPEEFFYDANEDTYFGCCRDNCQNDSGCQPTPTSPTCGSNQVIYNGQCVDNCPSGTEWDVDSNTCITPNQTPPPKNTKQSCPKCQAWNDTTGQCETLMCGINPAECEKQGKVIDECGCKCIDKVTPASDTDKKEQPKSNTVFYVVAGLAGVLILGGTIVALSSGKKDASSTPESA